MDNKIFDEKLDTLIKSKRYREKWVTIFRGKIVSIGDTYDESAAKARKKFGEKPMVTRKVCKGEERYWVL
ncbi:MAG: DUF5678 domain-containing protein [Candidatus Thermoplasmatota archaeon]